MSVYPSNIPTTGDLPDAGANLSSNPHSSLHDDVRDEVIAIAGELGVEPSGTANTVRARLDDGLGLREIVYFTSNGTFTKASYPWLRAVRVRLVGGGGGSGGNAATIGGEVALGGSGGGGGYSESFILASALTSTEAVTVGAGGAAGTSSTAGGAGGQSSFGPTGSPRLRATGGGGGGFGGNFAFGSQSAGLSGTGGEGFDGDLNIFGGIGLVSFAVSAVRNFPGASGASVFGGSISVRSPAIGGGGASPASTRWGVGAIGSNSIESQGSRNGAAGAQGIVIVELFA
jgi:hypothetical protein